MEHRDKGRLELNFVIPNIELQSGKRLQPYFDRADRPRVNAWQTLTNDRLGLRDPNDPTYRRPLTQASDLPRDKQQAAEKRSYIIPFSRIFRPPSGSAMLMLFFVSRATVRP